MKASNLSSLSPSADPFVQGAFEEVLQTMQPRLASLPATTVLRLKSLERQSIAGSATVAHAKSMPRGEVRTLFFSLPASVPPTTP